MIARNRFAVIVWWVVDIVAMLAGVSAATGAIIAPFNLRSSLPYYIDPLVTLVFGFPAISILLAVRMLLVLNRLADRGLREEIALLPISAWEFLRPRILRPLLRSTAPLVLFVVVGLPAMFIADLIPSNPSLDDLIVPIAFSAAFVCPLLVLLGLSDFAARVLMRPRLRMALNLGVILVTIVASCIPWCLAVLLIDAYMGWEFWVYSILIAGADLALLVGIFMRSRKFVRRYLVLDP